MGPSREYSRRKPAPRLSGYETDDQVVVAPPTPARENASTTPPIVITPPADDDDARSFKDDANAKDTSSTGDRDPTLNPIPWQLYKHEHGNSTSTLVGVLGSNESLLLEDSPSGKKGGDLGRGRPSDSVLSLSLPYNYRYSSSTSSSLHLLQGHHRKTSLSLQQQQHQRQPSVGAASVVSNASSATLVGRANDIEKQFGLKKVVSGSSLGSEKPLPKRPEGPLRKVARRVGICVGLCGVTVLFTISLLSVVFLILSINNNLIGWTRHAAMEFPIREAGSRLE